MFQAVTKNPVQSISILDFGADPSGERNSTEAIQRALNASAEGIPRRIVIPQGTFVTGLLQPVSNSEIHLEAGAVLKASTDYQDHTCEGKVGGIILARNLENFALTGPGLIDGSEETWFDFSESHTFVDYDVSSIRQGLEFLAFPKPFPDGPVKARKRIGNLLIFSNCRNLRLADFTVKGSAYWTIHLGDCMHFTVENLTVRNDPRCPNNDGIHLTSCRHGVLRNLRIQAGDDALALTGFRNLADEPEIALGFQDLPGVLSDITVEDCELSSRSSAIRIGYGANDMFDLRLRRIAISESNRGIAIQAREGGSIRDLLLEDIDIRTRFMAGSWWGNGEPVSLTAARRKADAGGVGSIQHVTLRRLRMTGPSPVLVHAESGSLIRQIMFEECHHRLRGDPLSAQRGETIDLRPIQDPSKALRNIEKCALYERGATDVDLVRCYFLDENGQPAISRNSKF